jgi:hypothetical protein
VSYRYPETLADPPDATRKPAREHVDAEVRRRASTVCKRFIPSPIPGALSILCPNEPVTQLGFCAEHLPK